MDRHARIRSILGHDVALGVLVLLIACDVAFIVVHGFAAGPLGQPSDPARDALLLSRDGSYAEWFQYLQMAVAVGLVAAMWLRDRQPVLVGWGLAFAYLLVDDAAQVHEGAGRVLVGLVGERFLGRSSQQLGELLLLGVVGVVLAGILVWTWQRSDDHHRRMSRALVALAAVLVTCGVVFDVAHGMFFSMPLVERVLEIAEDGGEMVAMSAIVALLWAHARRPATAWTTTSGPPAPDRVAPDPLAGHPA